MPEHNRAMEEVIRQMTERDRAMKEAIRQLTTGHYEANKSDIDSDPKSYDNVDEQDDLKKQK